MQRWSTIRVQLTLWYGSLFLLAGALLLGLNFVLVARNFPTGEGNVRTAVLDRLGLPAEQFAPATSFEFRPVDSLRLSPEARRGFRLADLVDNVALELRADTLRQLVVQSLIALFAMAGVSVLLGWWMAGRMLRPLHEIAGTMREISEQRLDRRVALDGPPDELKELADQFDAMLDRLQVAFASQREFVANASHELRTPLAIIRTELDVTLAGVESGASTPEDLRHMGEVVRRAIGRTEDLIERLMVLARAGEPLTRSEPFNLAQAAERALEAHRARIEERGIETQLDLQRARLTGDPVLLDSLVSNLVDNAVRYNEDGGRLVVATREEAGSAVLRVENEGAEVRPEEVARLFERFSRGDRSRSRDTGGYGLGLAIVQAIAGAHRGTVDARPRDGGGLVVEVRLPLPSRPEPVERGPSPAGSQAE